MLKNDVSLTSVCWTFLGRLGDVSPSATNIKNCNGFNILVKNENEVVAIDTYLNLFKSGGISVMEKVSLKIKQTIAEYRRDRNIGIYIWLTFSHVTETLSSNQTEPSGKM